MSKVRNPPVLIIDDHELIATALELALRGLCVDARRCQGRGLPAVLADAARHEPGVVLLDLDLGRDDDGRRIDGLDLVAPLVARGWFVVVVSGTTDVARLGGALDAGALGCLPKRAQLAHLLAAVRAAFAGQPVMDADRRQAFIDAHHQQEKVRRDLAVKLGRLSQREREVLAELAQGMRAQAIAEKYVVSMATVRTQIRGILTKLEVGSQLEAVALYRGIQPT